MSRLTAWIPVALAALAFALLMGVRDDFANVWARALIASLAFVALGLAFAYWRSRDMGRSSGGSHTA